MHSVEYEELKDENDQKIADVSANGNLLYADFRYAW
jgi:hypothetical protein